MKILYEHITTTTQIHAGKCYFLGCMGKYDTTVYNLEQGGTGAAGSTIAKYEAGGVGPMLPMPGIECNNGLNVVAEGWTTVYYYI